jgi:predicted ATPase
MPTNHVSKFQIKGFKCFVDKIVTFNSLTILAGSNSVGKSTTIQALLLSRLIADRTQVSKSFKWGRKFDETIPLNGDYLLSLGNSRQILSTHAKEDLIGFSFWETGTWETDVKPNASVYIQFRVNTTKATPELFLDFKEFGYHHKDLSPKYLLSLSIWQNEFYYLNAERIGPRVVYDMETQKFLNTGYQGEYSIQILAEYGQIKRVEEERSFEKQADTRLRHQVNEWMKYVIPGIDIEAKIYEQINKAQVGYNGHSPYNVGFGISYILPIIVSGLIAQKGSMLIIENPEAHLHPFGQSQIGKFLAMVANSGVQVVIETHSEHVINGSRLASIEGIIDFKEITINFFSKQEDTSEPKVNEIHLNSKADLSEWPQGFFDQQEQDLAKIFRFRRGQ